MDPIIQGLLRDVAQLQAQVAALQANVEWLTRYTWLLIAANAGSLIINGVLIRRNNNSRPKRKS